MRRASCVLAIALTAALSGCAYFPQRMGYDRNTGTWPDPVYRTPEERAASETNGATRPGSAIAESNGISRPAGAVAERKTGRTSSSLEKTIKPWLGVPYLYGGSTKKGTDCSGFVRNIMQEWAGISLPRTAAEQAKIGKSVSKGSLKAGDAVFFGQWNRVSHVGIALGDGNFAHASTSKGVTITPLDDPYWSRHYKGARRF